jgi:hypothetical protein
LFCLLRPKSKMENRYLFAKNFARCLVPFCKMIGQNPKFFGWNGELNTPIIATSEYPSFWIELLRFNQNMTSLVIKKKYDITCCLITHAWQKFPPFYFSVCVCVCVCFGTSSTLVYWNSHILLTSSQLMGCLSSSHGICKLHLFMINTFIGWSFFDLLYLLLKF